MKRKSKSVSFDTMVKIFIRNYDIPTRKDVDRLMARIERLELLIRAQSHSRGVLKKKKTAGGRRKRTMTATDLVMEVIAREKQGANLKTIQASTGFEAKKIRNIIYRMDKLNKIKRKRRGVYVIA